MAKKGFTPVIGLAVVVALALAAVFGAMSLTNPAFAAVGPRPMPNWPRRILQPQEDGQGVPMWDGSGGTINEETVELSFDDQTTRNMNGKF